MTTAFWLVRLLDRLPTPNHFGNMSSPTDLTYLLGEILRSESAAQRERARERERASQETAVSAKMSPGGFKFEFKVSFGGRTG